MKLICDVIINHLQNQGLAPKNRSKRSVINVGKNETEGIFILVQNAENKNGLKFIISKNIAQVFARYIHEGKCTLRFKNPNSEVCISKCDPLQLKLFIEVLKTGVLSGTDQKVKKDDTDSKKRLLNSLPQNHKKLKTSDLSKNRTELTITSRSSLLTTSFSHLLVKLEIIGLELSQIPPSISRLTLLKCLNLSGNKLKSLPTKFASKLTELNLSNNELGCGLHSTWRFFTLPEIKNNLQILNLSDNKLPYIPMDICNIKNLTKIELQKNTIRKFPPQFGRRLTKLRILDVSDNNLDTIDSSCQELRLETLNISGNEKSEATDNIRQYPNSTVPSLFQITSVYAVKNRLNTDILPLLIQVWLQTIRQCRCLVPVWHTTTSIIPYRLSNISQTVVSNYPDNFFNMAVYYCNSNTCRRT